MGGIVKELKQLPKKITFRVGFGAWIQTDAINITAGSSLMENISLSLVHELNHISVL